MERITMFLNGTTLLEGRVITDYENLNEDEVPNAELLLLVETEDQYVLQVGERIQVCENYDFDYRGLVDDLSEILKGNAVIDFMAWEFMDTVEAWADVDCDTSYLDLEVKNYFKKLGE